MTLRDRSGPCLAGLALILGGCEPQSGPSRPTREMARPVSSGDFSTPEPAIEPSPTPSLPSTPRGDLDKKDEAGPEAKKAAEPAKAESRPGASK